MTIFQEINKAWATLFGFKVESDEATFNDKPLYWNNNQIENWDDLLSAKASDLKQSAGVAEVPNTKTYDELMTAENFSYGAFDWTNQHGTRLGFSLGYLGSANWNSIFSTYLEFSPTGISLNYWGEENSIRNIYDNGLGFPNPNDYIALSVDDGSLDIDEIAIDRETPLYLAFYAQTEYYETVAFLYFIDEETTNNAKYVYNSTSNQWELYTNNIGIDGNSTLYFDDGAHLPEGVEWNDELRSYFVPTVKETETTTILTETTATQAMLGAQIMTHVTVWGMGIATGCFIVGLFKLFSKFLNRR